jgi:hypothetical protein
MEEARKRLGKAVKSKNKELLKTPGALLEEAKRILLLADPRLGCSSANSIRERQAILDLGDYAS